MTKKQPQIARKLAELGADELADALVNLAAENAAAARLVKRLTATKNENVRRFKAGLIRLTTRRGFVSYRESEDYTESLRDLLKDLESGVSDPRTGVELVAAFFRTDTDVFEAVDDSDGLLGNVFRSDASTLFAHYAAQCEDKEWIADVVCDLVQQDDYGVRDSLLGVAARFLPELPLRGLADRLWKAAEVASPKRRRRLLTDEDGSHLFLLVEQVALQLNDPVLYERARRAYNPELGTAACADIAAAWLAAGDPSTALSWLQKIKPADGFLSFERDDLLRTIHEQLGNRDEVERLAWKRFREYRSGDSLRDLLDVIGTEQRDAVVVDETRAILSAPTFVTDDAAFLVDVGRIHEAAEYVLERRSQLDGSDWSRLQPLAKRFATADYPLAASVICRALLDSILNRGYSPAYRHGAKYFGQLDRLAQGVADWGTMAPHSAYVAALRERHGRKSSFWSQLRA